MTTPAGEGLRISGSLADRLDCAVSRLHPTVKRGGDFLIGEQTEIRTSGI
jgi:hypothetical protein